MKNKKIIIPIALIAIVLIASTTIFMITKQKPEIEPILNDDGSLASVQVGDYIATNYLPTCRERL